MKNKIKWRDGRSTRSLPAPQPTFQPTLTTIIPPPSSSSHNAPQKKQTHKHTKHRGLPRLPLPVPGPDRDARHAAGRLRGPPQQLAGACACIEFLKRNVRASLSLYACIFYFYFGWWCRCPANEPPNHPPTPPTQPHPQINSPDPCGGTVPSAAALVLTLLLKNYDPSTDEGRAGLARAKAWEEGVFLKEAERAKVRLWGWWR